MFVSVFFIIYDFSEKFIYRINLEIVVHSRNFSMFTHKPSPIICSRKQFQILLLFHKQQIRYDISWESSAGRRLSWNIIPYFFWKFEKMSQNLSAAVVIGAYWVNPYSATIFLSRIWGLLNTSAVYVYYPPHTTFIMEAIETTAYVLLEK